VIIEEIIDAIRWGIGWRNREPTFSRHPLGGETCDACGAWWGAPSYAEGAGGGGGPVSTALGGGAGASPEQVVYGGGGSAK
jgi:hypothetical protein